MVENVSAAGSVEAPVTRHVLDNSNKVAIDDARLLFQGDYAREGHDLLISHDGRTVVVENYFIGDDGPSIAGPNGAFLSHETVSALAGPMAPAQYAQAGAASGLVEIGKIVKLSGTAQSQHPDGTEVELALDDPVYQGDVLSTGADSSLGISFVDESVFSMSADARMVLDELVYDPGDAENSSMVFNLVEGAFVFVTGEIAPTGNMKVETPVATMGIRGTTPKVLINTALGVVEFTILPDPDSGEVGVYQIVNRETGAIMGTVESSGDKWVVTTLTNEAVRIAKTGLDLLNDQIALDEIRDVFSRALGDRTQLDGATSFGQVGFDSTSSDGNGNGEGGDGGEGGGTGGNAGGEDGTPTNDSPPIAIDDFFTGGQNPILAGGSNVIDGIGGGLDTDPDGFPLKVTQVNGVNLVFVNGTASTLLPSGSILLINQPGSFVYDPNGAYDFLGSGDQDNDVFQYTIRDVGGFTDTATVTVTITGANDRPVITNISTTVHDGSITEDTDTGNAVTTRTSIGSITFTDTDASDTHTASFDTPAVTWTQSGGGSVSIAEVGSFALDLVDETAADPSPNLEFDANGVLIAVPDPVTGDVGWTYTVTEGDLDFLAAGETLTLEYTVTITDDSGVGAGNADEEPDSVTQVVTVTITGTNDAPVIQAATGAGVDTGTITELTDADVGTENAVTHSQTGTISFDDVDVSDVHTLTSTPDDNNPIDLPSADLIITQDPTTTDATTNGSFSWEFSVDDSELDFLAEGETRTFNYTLTLDDDNGGIDERMVTVTITGTNDTPVISTPDPTVTLVESETSISVDANFDVTDVDLIDTVNVASVTVTASGDNGGAPVNGDLLNMLTVTPPVSGTVIANNATAGSAHWRFESGADQFDYLALGEQLTLTYEITLADGHGGQDVHTVTIQVDGTNDAPVLTVDASGGVIEDATSPDLTATGALSFADVDVSDTHTISESYNSDAVWTGGNLTAQQIADLTSGFTADTDSWDYIVANADVQFLGAGETVIFSYDVTVTDDSGAANDSDTETVTITINGENDAPVVSSTTNPAAVGEGDTGVLSLESFTLADNLTASDIDQNDTPTIDETSVVISVNPASDTNDFSSLAINGSGDTTRIDVDTANFDFLADGEQAVFDVTFNVVSGTDTVQRQITITINGENDAPVVTAGGTLDWKIGDGAKIIDGAIAVNDVDSPDLIGATVTISGNHAPEDMLGFVDQNGISGDFNATTGELTLTGTASVEDYQTALQSITFATSGLPPSYETREISFVVNDGYDDSEVATSTVTVEPAEPTAYSQSVGTEDADTLIGGTEATIFFGMGGDDVITGGSDNDILVGGEGADTLTGGASSDIFVFDDTSSFAMTDTVLDFVASDDDILDPGEDIVDLEALLSGAFDPAAPGAEITFTDNTPDGVTLVVDGNPVADLNGVNDGDFVHVIHDQAEAAIAVQIMLA